MKSTTMTRIAVGIVLASTAPLHAQHITPYDTAYGEGALPNAGTPSDAENSAFGAQALNANTTGTENTGVGFSALSHNTSGVWNTAVGVNALLLNTTGSLNVAVGALALQFNNGSYNAATGVQALYFNSGGNYNVASGYAALYSNNSSNNTAIGTQALYNATGNTNTALGYYAGGNVANGSNNIHIGNPGANGDNGAIKIGFQGTQTSTLIAGIYGANSAGVPVYINSNGQLGTVASSRRFKEQITDMGHTSDKLFQLRPVNFVYKPEYDDGSHSLQYGLIAEEVEKVYPEMVAYDSDGQIMTVKYQMLAPMLLNEAQKHKAEIQAEREKNAEQAEQIRSLEQRLASLEALLSEQTPTLARPSGSQ
jgi:hypothetical protein